MEDAKATATTIVPLFAPIRRIIVGVVRAHKDAIHNAPSRAEQDVLHSVQNRVAWDAPAIVPKHVVLAVPHNVPNLVDRDVIRLVLQDVQTIVLVSVIILAMDCAKDIAGCLAEGRAMNIALAVHLVANTLTTELVDIALPTAMFRAMVIPVENNDARI